MSTPKDAIAEALLSLDHTDDKLWTDDGSPLVSAVAQRCNDVKITRAQINEALPGFARKTSDSVAEDVQPENEISDEARGAYQLMAPPEAPASEVQASDELLGLDLSPEQEHERLRQLAHQRVKDAEVALSDAKELVAEANRGVLMAEQRLTRAVNIFSSKYPPISVSENIQQHIRKQQELLYERVTGFKPGETALNPVDANLMDRKRDNGRNKGITPAPFLPRKASVSY